MEPLQNHFKNQVQENSLPRHLRSHAFFEIELKGGAQRTPKINAKSTRDPLGAPLEVPESLQGAPRSNSVPLRLLWDPPGVDLEVPGNGFLIQSFDVP